MTGVGEPTLVGPGQSSGKEKAKGEVTVALGWRMRWETRGRCIAHLLGDPQFVHRGTGPAQPGRLPRAWQPDVRGPPLHPAPELQ